MARVDGLPTIIAKLEAISISEEDQANIGKIPDNVTITSTNWNRLAVLDQSLATTDNPVFATVRGTGDISSGTLVKAPTVQANTITPETGTAITLGATTTTVSVPGILKGFPVMVGLWYFDSTTGTGFFNVPIMTPGHKAGWTLNSATDQLFTFSSSYTPPISAITKLTDSGYDYIRID
ncbi:MAG: hypothetical protein AABZ14_02425, partial [Candidatus Margulisiibacteriota bacterium]